MLAGVQLEEVAKGRQGAVLLDPHPDGRLPLVRSTTRYTRRHQRVPAVVAEFACGVQAWLKSPKPFNNIMVEKYSSAYRTMGLHTDQALDLDPESLICLVTLYGEDGVEDGRELVVTDKEARDPAAVTWRVPLLHGTVVSFSVATNARHTHAIVAARAEPAASTAASPGRAWVGITLRTSRRALACPQDGQAELLPGVRLLLAEGKLARAYYCERARENRVVDFEFDPALDHLTISPSDVMAIL